MIYQLVIVLVSVAYVDAATSGEPCADLATNCAENNNLCTNRIYEALMRLQCRQTCGICTAGNCKDNNANCGVWKQNGFCQSPFYTVADKKQFCQLSCDIECGTNSGASG